MLKEGKVRKGGQNQKPKGPRPSRPSPRKNLNESHPNDWVRVVLMVSPDAKEFHAVGGDREPGEGDTPYIGYELLKKYYIRIEPNR